MRFPGSVRRDPAIDTWMDRRPDALGAIARRWFEIMRGCGADVRELLHDGHPTACVADAAFAYVNAFTAHVNVGFTASRRAVRSALYAASISWRVHHETRSFSYHIER